MRKQTVTGGLFGIAIVTAVLSTIVRIRLRNGLGLDDIFLLLACVFLIASTVLLFLASDALYFEEALTLDPESVTFSAGSFDQLDWYQKVIYAYLDLSQTATYCVKFSFLCFFRLLIDRLRYMIVYWRVVVVVSVLAWAYAMCTAFIGCPDFGLNVCRYCAFSICAWRETDRLSSCSLHWRSRFCQKCGIVGDDFDFGYHH